MLLSGRVSVRDRNVRFIIAAAFFVLLLIIMPQYQVCGADRQRNAVLKIVKRRILAETDRHCRRAIRYRIAACNALNELPPLAPLTLHQFDVLPAPRFLFGKQRRLPVVDPCTRLC